MTLNYQKDKDNRPFIRGNEDSIYNVNCDTGDEEDLAPARARAVLLKKIVAVLTLLIFIFIVLANLLRFFTLPSLTFLQESRELEDDPVLQELQQAVVQVLYVSRDGSAPPVARRKGTGFNIHSSGLIVTNKHVVEGADAITVSFADAGSYMVSHWTESSRLDLALLHLDQTEDPGIADPERESKSFNTLPCVELLMQPFPEIGSEVIIMGNPLGFRRIISRGNVSAYYSLDDLPYPVIEIIAPIYAGSSGSPVFDKEHKVVAVVYASLSTNEGDEIKGLAIPVFYLQELVEEALSPAAD